MWAPVSSRAARELAMLKLSFVAVTATYPPSWFVANSFARNKDGTIPPDAWESAKRSGKVKLGRAIT